MGEIPHPYVASDELFQNELVLRRIENSCSYIICPVYFVNSLMKLPTSTETLYSYLLFLLRVHTITPCFDLLHFLQFYELIRIACFQFYLVPKVCSTLIYSILFSLLRLLGFQLSHVSVDGLS